jgi:hypothetical protein
LGKKDFRLDYICFATKIIAVLFFSVCPLDKEIKAIKIAISAQ